VGSNRIVVLTALPLEAAAVRAHLPERIRHDLPAGTIVEEGDLPGTGYRVCLVCTGPGNGQAAVVAERVIGWADPAAVLFVGIAGAVKPDVHLGDVVAATRVMDYQGGKDTPTGFAARPEAWAGAHRLVQVAQYVDANGTWHPLLSDGAAPRVHSKPIASGDRVKDTDASPLVSLLHSNYNDAIAIETEAAGVARAAQHTGVELLVIRGISDRSDGTKASSDGDDWQSRAARNAAALALGVIAALPFPASTGAPIPVGQPAEANRAISAPDWRVITPAAAVLWRADFQNNHSVAPATLEVHLVPMDQDARLQVTQLRTLSDNLVQVGRARGLFGQAAAVDNQHWAEGAVALSRLRQGTGTSGLAVLRTGQRSAWEPLPTADALHAAIFDPDHLTSRLTELINNLLAIPHPLAGQVIPVAGIDPAMMITRGAASMTHLRAATLRGGNGPLRTEATEAVSVDNLRHTVTAVAAELAARLDLAYDARR
jgi:nucleoside phosphorylase